jgi:hypothetical protein
VGTLSYESFRSQEGTNIQAQIALAKSRSSTQEAKRAIDRTRTIDKKQRVAQILAGNRPLIGWPNNDCVARSMKRWWLPKPDESCSVASLSPTRLVDRRNRRRSLSQEQFVGPIDGQMGGLARLGLAHLSPVCIGRPCWWAGPCHPSCLLVGPGPSWVNLMRVVPAQQPTC